MKFFAVNYNADEDCMERISPKFEHYSDAKAWNDENGPRDADGDIISQLSNSNFDDVPANRTVELADAFSELQAVNTRQLELIKELTVNGMCRERYIQIRALLDTVVDDLNNAGADRIQQTRDTVYDYIFLLNEVISNLSKIGDV